MNILNNISSMPSTAEKVKQYNPAPVIKTESKKDFLDIFSEKVANRKDITDTVVVPRAIFKGYLCFTAGTAINAIAGMIKKGTVSKVLGIAGSLTAIYGTFNFVKPFIIKEKKENLTEGEK